MDFVGTYLSTDIEKLKSKSKILRGWTCGFYFKWGWPRLKYKHCMEEFESETDMNDKMMTDDNEAPSNITAGSLLDLIICFEFHSYSGHTFNIIVYSCTILLFFQSQK